MRRTCRRTYSGSEEGVLLVTVRAMFLVYDLAWRVRNRTDPSGN